MDVKEADLLGPDLRNHWYYVSKGRALRQLLGSHVVDEVLDVGAGSGVFSRQLLDAGICRGAVCLDTAYETERVESHNGRTIQFRRSVETATQRLVLMIDVLEHVDDDVALLRRYSATMPKDGRVLISVPAFSFLWSGHDVFLDHRRRYSLPQLERVVREAGLQPLRTRYFFALIFPAVCVARLIDRGRVLSGSIQPKSSLRKHSDLVNRALTRIHDVERSSLFRFNRLGGLSVVCLAGVHR